MNKLQGEVKSPRKISGNVGAKTINIGGRPYDGQYEINPMFETQKLNTKNAILNDDVLVHPISVNKTANNAGGNTVVIGD